MNISQKHPKYDEITKHYTNGLLLMGGSIAMRESSDSVLPRNQYETTYNYNARVARTILLNVYKSSHDTLTKKPFQKPVVWSADLPPELGFIQYNIDGSGTTQEAFYEQLVSHSLRFGKHIFLVNMPNLFDAEGKKISESARKENNLNPFVSLIQPDSLISWFYGADKKMNQIKVEYTAEALNEEGEIVIVSKIDIITRVSKETYFLDGEAGSDNWILEGQPVPISIGEIAIVIGNDIYALPVLENLAELNILHYGKVSDKDNNINIAMTPFLHFGGFDKDETQATVSVQEAYINSSSSSFIKWVEIGGQGITIAIEDIVKLEARMKASGSDIIKGFGSAKTATETNKDDSDDLSALQSIVLDVEQSAKKMITFMALWLGIKDPELNLTIYKDFNVKDNQLEELKHLQRDRLSGDISQETYLNELKTSNVLKTIDFDVASEIEKTAIMNFEDDTIE